MKTTVARFEELLSGGLTAVLVNSEREHGATIPRPRDPVLGKERRLFHVSRRTGNFSHRRVCSLGRMVNARTCCAIFCLLTYKLCLYACVCMCVCRSRARARRLSTFSLIRSAMRRLDPGSDGSSSSMVRQLYALALLNREDARRRLSSSSGMPADMLLAQQPPSLLALAGPPPQEARFGSSPGGGAGVRGSLNDGAGGSSMDSGGGRVSRGRPRPFTSGFSRPGAGRFRSGESSRQSGRHFGALSVSSQSGGDSEAIAARAISAARAPSLAVTAVGADLSALTANVGGYGGAACASHARSRTRSADQLGSRQRFGASEGIMSSSGGPGGGGDSPTTPSRAALQVTDLERMGCPTKVSTLPSRRADAHAAALEKERRELEQAKLASTLQKGSLSVRTLLHAEGRVTDGSGRFLDSDYANLTAVARATTASDSVRPSRRRGNPVWHVPDPRATPGGGIDPWRASEEDLKRQARGQQMQDDMAAIRRAAAVGYAGAGIPGFG